MWIEELEQKSNSILSLKHIFFEYSTKALRT